MFRIELELLTGACGDSGEMKLKELFMEFMPSATNTIELQLAIQKSSVMQASRLWGMVGGETQGLIRAGMGMLNDIYQGEPPRLPQGACPWLVEVYSRLPWFATATQLLKDKDGKSIKKQIFGKVAVQHAWDTIQEKDISEVGLQEPHDIGLCIYELKCHVNTAFIRHQALKVSFQDPNSFVEGYSLMHLRTSEHP